MTTPSDLDAQWCAQEDELALGDLALEDAVALDSDVADPRWDAEASFYEDLQTLAEPAADASLEDAALIDAVLASETPTAGEGSRGVVWLSVGVLAAAAAALVVWWGASAWSVPRAIVDSGEWVAQDDGAAARDGDAMPLAVWLVADADACGSIDGAVLCASQGTVVRMSPPRSGAAPQIELASGSVTVTKGRWTVLAGDESHTLVAGESFSFEDLGDDDPAPSKPTAAIEPPTTSGTPLPSESESGDVEAEPSKPRNRSRTTPREDAATMLSAARALRGAGKRKKAAKAYASLLSAHPKSAEANAARVSLGQLRLESGRAKAALSLFNRYLAGGGALAEEALWGKVKALHALHRKKELARAVDQLERRFPRSVYLSRAKDRAGQ